MSKKRSPEREEEEERARKLFLDSLDRLDPSQIKRKLSSDAAPKPKKSSGTFEKRREIDLHGMTLLQAQAAVDRFIASILADGSAVKVRIITGKGLHSGPSGAVLSRDIYDHVKRVYHERIQTIDEPPQEVRLGGVPIRGHFDVSFTGK